jgi:hypothetical protein
LLWAHPSLDEILINLYCGVYRVLDWISRKINLLWKTALFKIRRSLAPHRRDITFWSITYVPTTNLVTSKPNLMLVPLTSHKQGHLDS